MTAIVWLRRDLRVHDHPPLARALAEHDRVVPLFVLDPALLRGRHASPNRIAYLLDTLRALDGELRARGARLVVREGRPEQVVPRVAAEAGARRVYAAGDVSRFARRRDARVAERVDLMAIAGRAMTTTNSKATVPIARLNSSSRRRDSGGAVLRGGWRQSHGRQLRRRSPVLP